MVIILINTTPIYIYLNFVSRTMSPTEFGFYGRQLMNCFFLQHLVHPRGRLTELQVTGIPGPEPEPDRRDLAGHLPDHDQPQRLGLKRQRHQKGNYLFLHNLYKIKVRSKQILIPK
jgi:hypothetical protein